MSITPEYAAGWRELTCELTADQIEDLEALEHDYEHGLMPAAWGVELSDNDVRSLLVQLAQKDVVSNVRAMMLAEVQLPDGAAVADDWDGDDSPQRVVFGPERGVTGHQVVVRTSCVQACDGRIGSQEVSISGDAQDRGLQSWQARELAAVLLAAADEIDGRAR
jgi:hypothetical protein